MIIKKLLILINIQCMRTYILALLNCIKEVVNYNRRIKLTITFSPTFILGKHKSHHIIVPSIPHKTKINPRITCNDSVLWKTTVCNIQNKFKGIDSKDNLSINRKSSGNIKWHEEFVNFFLFSVNKIRFNLSTITRTKVSN